MTNECSLEYLLKRMQKIYDNRTLICHECDSLFEWDGKNFPEVCPICDAYDDYHVIQICTPGDFFEYDVDWESYLGKGIIQFGWRKNAVVTVLLDKKELIFVDTTRIYKKASRIALSDEWIDKIRVWFSYEIEQEKNGF